MPFKFLQRFKNNQKSENETKSITTIFQQASKSSDFHQFSPLKDKDIIISYYKNMVDTEKINNLLLPSIQEHNEKIGEINDIKKFIPFEDAVVTADPLDVEKKGKTLVLSIKVELMISFR